MGTWVTSADEHSKRRSKAEHGRPDGAGVQVEVVENLSAVVHREQFDSFGGVRQSSQRASTHIALALHAV
jgi:hypothetical protein